MNRRNFIASATTGVVAGLSGCLSGQITGDIGNIEPPKIDVKLFQTDEMMEQSPPSTDSKYVLDQSKHLIEDSFNTFSFDIDVDVEVSEIQVSESRFSESGNPFDIWSDIVEDEIPSEETVDDCNMIFMNRDIPGVAGRAQFPCGCESPRSSVIYGASDLYYTESELINTEETYDTTRQRYPVVVHEVGHQMGLTHNMGSVDYEDQEDKHVVTSVMLERYLLDFDENYKGENVFDDYDSRWSIYQKASFNSEITEEEFLDAFNN